MEVGDLKLFLRQHWPTIEQELKQGKYKPQPVKKVEIPKPDGGVRMLGIPTVLDRFLQQALLQVRTPIWEPTFSDNNFGFRPGRKEIDAVNRAKGYQEEGYRIVIDMDLSKFFDEIPHDRLMSKIMLKTPGEREIHKLIHRYLTAGMVKDGKLEVRLKGTPQGGLCKALHNPPCVVQFHSGIWFVMKIKKTLRSTSYRAASRLVRLSLAVPLLRSQCGSRCLSAAHYAALHSQQPAV